MNKKLNINFDANIQITKHYVSKSEEENGDEEEGDWIVEGYAATSDLDSQDEIITEEALKNSANDLIENSTVLFNHDIDISIGRVLESTSEQKGLKVKVLISKTVPHIWKQIQEGVLNKFSIRARVIDAVKKFVEEVGKTVRIIKQMHLLEVSLVPLPANSRAKAIGWYIEKALNEFEAQGGELPMNEEEKKLEELRKQQEKFQKTDAEKEAEAKKSAEEKAAEELRKSKEAEKAVEIAKKAAEEATLKATQEKNAEKKFSQAELDAAVAKAIADQEQKKADEVSKLSKQMNDLQNRLDEKEADANVEKQWSSKYASMYSSEDAPVIKGLLKKLHLGKSLTMEETNMLIEKKAVQEAEEIPSTTDVISKGIKTTKSREELLKLGNIRVKKA